MKTNGRVLDIAMNITIISSIALDAREAGFLRVMAQHCIDTDMPGSNGARQLIRALDRAQVPEYEGGPVYGLFEEGP